MLKDCQNIYDQTREFVNEFRDKVIFVTGGTGFIGKWFLEYFLFLNKYNSIPFKILVLSRNPKKFLNKYPKFDVSFIEFIQGDILKFDFDTLPDCDFIIHAATDADAKLNFEQPFKMIDTIVEGTRKVLDFGVRVQSSKVLYLSSGAIYGVQPDHFLGFSEDYFGGPNILEITSAYAEAKRMAELLCKCYSEQYNIDISIARCFAFVGPYLPLDMHFAIGNFINNGINGDDIIIKGNGLPLRSYMYSTDLIVWLFFILFRGKNGQAYNVGSNKSISIGDLGLVVSKFFPNLNVKIMNQLSTTDRNQNYIPDTSKITTELAVKLTIDLESAIKKTIDYYKNNIL